MKKRYLASILVLILCLSVSSEKHASGVDEESENMQTLFDDAEHKRYKIGTYLLNIGKIDLQSGSYDLDFYIWVSSNQTDFTKTPPKLDFMNGKVTLEPISVTPHYYEAHAKGAFLKNMDFHNFPFEKLDLTVEVEGTEDTSGLVFRPDTKESGYDKMVNIPGWILSDTESKVTLHSYPSDTFSRYVFSFTIERALLSSFLKTLFPVIIITTIAMLAFWMSPSNFPTRIALSATTLLAAVAAHLNAAGQLPPIGYLTFLDKIMIIVYALFLNNLLSLVIQMRLIDNKKEDDAVKVNKKMRRLMPIIIVSIFTALILFDI